MESEFIPLDQNCYREKQFSSKELSEWFDQIESDKRMHIRKKEEEKKLEVSR